jgi:hypothetical protein
MARGTVRAREERCADPACAHRVGATTLPTHLSPRNLPAPSGWKSSIARSRLAASRRRRRYPCCRHCSDHARASQPILHKGRGASTSPFAQLIGRKVKADFEVLAWPPRSERLRRRCPARGATWAAERSACAGGSARLRQQAHGAAGLKQLGLTEANIPRSHGASGEPRAVPSRRRFRDDAIAPGRAGVPLKVDLRSADLPPEHAASRRNLFDEHPADT